MAYAITKSLVSGGETFARVEFDHARKASHPLYGERGDGQRESDSRRDGCRRGSYGSLRERRTKNQRIAYR